MKKLRMICLLITALMALALPGAVFAQNAPGSDPGPQWNIKIEFRYTKGQESRLNIPDSIARYGRTYHLISKTDPVLEKKLPAVREYTWLIDGTVSESEKHLLDGVENVELIPTDVEIGRVVDKHVKEGGYPTNDVEDIAYSRVIDGVSYNRAAVRFEEEAYDDFDLPVSYEAEIVYRGLEIYMGPGYTVKATYTTSEDLDGVPQYVIVATYAPDGLEAVGGTTGGSGTGAAPSPSGEDPAVTAAAAEPENIGEDLVPLAAADEEAAKGLSPIALALIIIAAVLGGFAAWMFFTRKRNIEKKRLLREERRRAALLARGLTEYDG